MVKRKLLVTAFKIIFLSFDLFNHVEVLIRENVLLNINDNVCTTFII